MSTTKLWKLQIPVGGGFAELLRHFDGEATKKCVECGASLDGGHRNLVVEWDDGSDEVGDFVHAGADIILKNDVATRLRQIVSGFTTAPLTFFDHPNLYKPETVPQIGNARKVWLPYDGPALSHLIVTRKVPLADQSTVDVDRICETCSSIRYKRIEGVEKKNSSVSRPRESGKGLFVNSTDLGNDSIFSPIGTSLVLCTNDVKEFIVSENFSNIELLEYGDVI